MFASLVPSRDAVKIHAQIRPAANGCFRFCTFGQRMVQVTGSLFWFDGATLIGKSIVSGGSLAWRPSSDGVHLVRVIDDHGRAAERDVEVQFAR